MKQTIRANVFETNSSSAHALIVPKEIKNIEEIKDYDVEITADEFGWGYEEYNDPYTILSYLWTGLQGTSAEERLHELFPKIKFIPFQEDYDCYIDHQSHDLPFVLIEQSDDVVYNIVANGKLIISNDNGDYDIVYDSEKEDVYDYMM